MAGDETVRGLCHFGKTGDSLVEAQRPLLLWIDSQTAKHSLSPRIDRSISRDKMNGLLEFGAGELGKIFNVGGLLQRQVFDSISGGLFPALNPQAAEAAFAVEKHERFARAMGDSTGRIHEDRVK